MIATITKMRRIFALALFFTSVMAASGAHAACFSLSVPSGAITVNYNPLDNVATLQNFTIQFQNNSCGSATVQELGISNVPRNTSNAPIGSPINNGFRSRAIKGSLVTQFDRDTPDLAYENLGTITNGQSVSAEWQILIGTHAIIPYASRDFTIYVNGRMKSTTIQLAVNVHLNIASVTELSFAGAATTLTMDFGEINSNAVQNINVLAQATVPFDIVWTSDNNGVLKNLSDSSWTIPYTANLNGTVLDNSTPYSDTTLGGTQGASTTLPLAVTIGDATKKRAGTYRDVITIQIQPR